MPDDKKPKEPKEALLDSDLWAYVTKDIQPLNETVPKLSQKIVRKESPVIKKGQEKPDFTVKKDMGTKQNPSSQGYQVDRRTSERLRRGKMPIEGRLDLHGLTQIQAFDALQSFIPKAYYARKRCVLVITGKGHDRSGNAPIYAQKKGVLRQKTPQWLLDDPLQQYVLKIEQSRPEHGGEGAFYVLLRRQRD